MRSILIYLEPDENERDRLVAMASNLVDFVAASVDDRYASLANVGVVAEPEDCAEIGLVMLGRGTARTVEHGEREATLLRLFPFRPSREPDEALDRASESLNDLSDAGAVEGLEERVTAPDLPDATHALSRALEYGRWADVVVLGDPKSNAKLLQVWETKEKFRVIRLEEPEKFTDRVGMLAQRLDLEKDDHFFHGLRRKAVRDVVQFENLIDQLGLLK